MLTDEETFSASSLINRYLDVLTPEAKQFLAEFLKVYGPEDIMGYLDAIAPLKVLTVGETIIDEYQFCDVMGKANKDPILAARHLHTETYPGGVLALANHLSDFSDQVALLSMLGDTESKEALIREGLDDRVNAYFVHKPDAPTILKRRFLHKYLAVKLFEVYVMENENLTDVDEEAFCEKLEALLPEQDVVIVVDYGHGLFTSRIRKLICDRAKFLAVNTQRNAGNQGFNTILKYDRADFISLAEPEIRLVAHDDKKDMETLIRETAERLSCKRMIVTWGEKGCFSYDAEVGVTEVPAFAVKLVDRIGAGDALLSLAGPCAALGVPADALGFIANVVGAEACATMGNKSAIEKTSLYRHISSLLK